MYNRLKQFLYQKYLSTKFEIKFYSNVRVNNNSKFEGCNALYNNVSFLNSELGLGSYIANNSIIKKTKIGRFCSIGGNVRTGLGIHPTKKFVSTHPAFYSLKKQAGFTFVKKQLFEEHRYVDEEKKYYVEIGNDVWIGNNVLILDGVKIGNGAVIAAGSIVNKNVDDYAIVGGIPSEIIKYRYGENIRDILLKIKWWKWNVEEFKKKSDKFKNIDLFINEFSND
ncbi:MAG: CatB-related O-acetyltransferase [Candidatus Marinimicrobia bacterium]|nr:CatB-related O-acetyltransferase [Candidatus Neomarinimicrobiota bacterium]MCF7828737.1 CatB-related O-acetyltransferase [Candidatus Neomarinimicrobiota bacterium]MCF7880654.1 CatB-related O-acetyltransferase [Candidatus Neomarinimicrobiota bacterium]